MMLLRTSEAVETAMGLERQDLISFEPELRRAIAGFLLFSSYGLYFPSSPPPEMLVPTNEGGHRFIPVYYPSEKKALLPLHQHGELLGIFVARGVSGRVTKTMINLWSCLCLQVVDNLLMHKMTRIDPLTGLANNVCLEETLAREIRLVQRGLLPDNPVCLEDGFVEFSASVGLICVDVDDFSRINEQMGYQFGDTVLKDLARAISQIAPEQALCARLREDTLGLCFSGASASKCQQLTTAIAQSVEQLQCVNSISGEKIPFSVSQGYATYPQDFHGRQLRKSVREQTGLLLEKAQRALRNAQVRGSGQIRGFSDILRESGVILEILPMNRVLVSLGRSVDAQEGQRFLVWSAQRASPGFTEPGVEDAPCPKVCKGEVQLVEVQRGTSVAEIILLHEPSCGIRPDDHLSILSPGRRDATALNLSRMDLSSDEQFQRSLLTSREFIKHWVDVRQQYSQFALMLLHLEGISGESERIGQVRAEHKVQELAEILMDMLGPLVVIGRFSFSTLVCLIPGTPSTDVGLTASGLVRRARENSDLAVYIGVAGFPFLAYSKAEILENCRKALEHALMLPVPNAVEFCSTSLTVSADRFFTNGDLFSALEEYKLALLADDMNHLARNSLGVCYAKLGKLNEALAQFSFILKVNSEDIMAAYNLGHTLLKQGEQKRAEQAFRRCLELDPRHVFSLLRLGQFAEQIGDYGAARDYFDQVRQLPGGEAMTHRHLARLEMRQGNTESAREHLHQALVHNPKDALAMHLLAQMYLEQGEDPEIAETLARQSVALRPEQSAFWKTLSSALDIQGRHDEAVLAREHCT
jgi:diguanylate cyclase (GGDEF)-like protein